MRNHHAAAALLAIALIPGLARAGQGRAAVDLNALAHELAERVRHLGEDVASDMGQTPQGRHLAQDTAELAQAVDEFHDGLHRTPDPGLRRQAFAGIDSTWQHLRGQLARGASPAVLRAADRVEQLDAQIRQALGLNNPPAAFYGGPPAPTGVADTQRLAHALAARADALAAVVRTDLGRDPNGVVLVRAADELAAAADAFHDAIDANPAAGAFAPAFAPVDALSDRVQGLIDADATPPRVRNAWQSFASVEVLLHRNLRLDTPPRPVPIVIEPPDGGPSPVLGLADQLLQQVGEFLRVFGPTAGVVPEGEAMLADAQRLQAAAAAFRQAVAENLPPNRLAYEFREVDASSRRLSRRVNRIAAGRVGPNIEQVRRIGVTADQIHRVLGMPGYPPSPYGAAHDR